MNTELKIDWLEQRSQLDELEIEWDELLAVSEVATPFLTPGWQRAWLDTYGRGRKLVVLTARRGTVLVGLWPLAIIRRGLFRVLEPIGAGRSDWLDVLAAGTERPDVIEAFLAFLAKRNRDWDLLDCRDVLEHSPSIPLLEALCARQGLNLRRQDRTAAPYLKISGTWDEYLRTRTKKFRSNLSRARRKVESDSPGFSIKRLDWREGGDIVAQLAAVELRSWKKQEGNLKLGTALGHSFYERFCAYFAARGQLELWAAHCDGRVIAFLINMFYGGKCYFYNGSFDQQYAELSPGLLLNASAISDAFERKLSEYDFLSGEEPYKDLWSSDRRQIHHLAIYNRRAMSGIAFATLLEARWALRRSERLRTLRAKLLAAARKLLRRRES